MSFRPISTDPFEALAREPAAAPAADPFDALLAEPEASGGTGAAAGADVGGALAPARQQMSVGQNLAAGTADAVDFIWGGFFAPILGTAGEVVTRVGSSVGSATGITPPKTRKQVSAEAETVRNDLNRKYGQPARDVLTALGVIPEGESFIGEKVMGPAMKKIDEWGADLEASSGGLVVKEDVNAFVNMLFGAMGAKGAQVGAKSYLDRQKARYIAAELERRQALDAGKALEVDSRPVPPQVRAMTEAYQERLARGMADESSGVAMTDWQTAAPEMTPEFEAFLRQYAGDGSDAPFRSPTPPDYSIIGNSSVPEYVKEMTRERGFPAAPGTWLADERAAGRSAPPAPARPAPDTSITAAVGDATDQTTMMVSGRRPDMNLPAAAGAAVATGAALYALAPDREEAALMAATGAGLAVGRGRGLTLAALQTMPDATPLRAILDQSGYTFSTLEKLPGNRFQFARQQITDLLKRQEVTKMERDVIEAALRDIPGDGPVTAKQLMEGVKKAAGDFELGIKKTNGFADYGLDAISRGYLREDSTAAAMEGRTPPGWTATRAGDEWIISERGRELGRTADGDFDLSPEEAIEAYIDETPGSVSHLEPPLTRIYQSPLQLGSGNHFGDPNYFAHTRSFEAGGVRHVVELQSDLVSAQIGEMQKAKLRAELADVEVKIASFEAEIRRRGLDPRNTDHRELSRLMMRKREIDSKLAPPGPEIAATEPMLKNWYKRIIREEVADAAAEQASSRAWLQNYETRFPGKTAVSTELTQARARAASGPPKIRFADADTVAKVEGWPRADHPEAVAARAERQQAIREIQEGNLRGSVSEELLAREEAANSRLLQFRDQPGPLTSKEHQSIYDRYSGDITKFLKQLGAKHVTDSAGHGWWEIPLDESNKSLPAGGLQGIPGRPRLQMGAADPRLMQAIALFGGGAALGAILSDPGQKGEGALKGLAAGGAALVGLSLLSRSGAESVAAAAKGVGERAAYTVGVISRDIKALSPPLLRRLTAQVKSELVGQHDRLLAITPFVEGFKALPKATRDLVDSHWQKGDRAAVIRAIGAAGKPALVAELRKAMQVRKDLEMELRRVGRLTVPLEEFPRVVSDMEGLMAQLNKDAGRPLALLLREMNNESYKLTGEPLSPFDISNMLGQATAGNVSQYSKFFASASEAYPLWVRAATRELERIKFLGSDAVLTKKNGRLNLSASIQNVVNRELAAGRITPSQGDKMRSILMDRFGPGERPTPGYAQTYKNIVYTALLANPISTATQLVDVGTATAIHGMMPTLKALQAITTKSPSRWTLADMGLVNHLTEEMLGSGRKPLRIGNVELSTARILEQSLRMGGLPVLKHLSFSAVDELGKLTHLNAANAKFQKLAKSARGQAEIQRRYGDYFGADLGQLLTDLRTGAKTPLVGELLFRELSDVQPITKLEMPQAYLANPGARFAYTLKSFLIRQINLMVDRGVAEIAKGDAASIGRGTAFLAKYMLTLGAAGASVDFIKDLLMGRRANLEWGGIAENMMKGWGWSSYALETLRTKGPAAAVGQLVVPPWKLFDEIVRGDPKAMQYLPWVGKLYYNWMMGGNEKADISRSKREAQREKEAEMTDDDRAEREERRDRLRERRRERDLENLR